MRFIAKVCNDAEDNKPERKRGRGARNNLRLGVFLRAILTGPYCKNEIQCASDIKIRGYKDRKNVNDVLRIPFEG